MKLEIPLPTHPTTGAKAILVHPGDSARSNLLRALRAGKLLVTLPGGKEEEWDWEKVMPPGSKKPTEAQILQIKRWIDHGCPEHRPK